MDLIPLEELKQLQKIKGEIRGVIIKGDGDFVLKEKGREGLRLLEEKMAFYGYPIQYDKIKIMAFYPLVIDAVNLVLIKRLFKFDEKKMNELGRFLSRSSLVLRIFMKYFVSLDMVAKKAPLIWRKNYSVGELEVAGLNKEKRELIVRIKNFSPHHYYCLVVPGYLSSVVEMIVRKKVRCKERKCIFRGDPYNEFLLCW